jgi:hypothetical protein
MASVMTKEALAYAKAGRPKAAEVLDDLRQATSLDNIKVAARAAGGSYPMANPYGDLIRSEQKVARLLEDALAAKDKNEFLYKEATVRFQKAMAHHLREGGNIGEITHLMAHVSPDETMIKSAMSAATKEIQKHGFNLAALQAQSINYEMEKGASARTVNPQHPISDSYATMCKLAEGQRVLDESYTTLKQKHEEIESVLKQAMSQDAAAV